jgi:hypothetical protein
MIFRHDFRKAPFLAKFRFVKLYFGQNVTHFILRKNTNIA